MDLLIPKTIHYCWFGRNPKPEMAKKCIKSWKRYCPDYKIIEWNEDNFDLSACPLYVRQAYEAKKWAYVTDYVRLQLVYEHGGIYMDTDVELKKNLDPLLCHQAYFGFEDGVHIATGLGFGAVQGHSVLKEIMDDYAGVPFIYEDGTFDMVTCPQRNTKIFLRHGMKQDDSMQILDGDILILPSIYLCPISYQTNIRRRSDDTISIHWFDASWKSREEKKLWEKRVRKETIKRWVHNIIGDRFYQMLKVILRRDQVS